MAIVNFGGALQIAQNFTDDAQRLKNVVNGVKFSDVAPNASDASVPQLSAQMASFGARDVLYALKDLAKSLSAIPARKTVIMITGGFPADLGSDVRGHCGNQRVQQGECGYLSHRRAWPGGGRCRKRV